MNVLFALSVAIQVDGMNFRILKTMLLIWFMPVSALNVGTTGMRRTIDEVPHLRR